MDLRDELLKELHRLNRSGVINDEEFLVLRKIIAGGGRISPDLYQRFDRLFATDPKSVPAESIKKRRGSSYSKGVLDKDERLYSMDEAINELNLRLKPVAGGFGNWRELLSCPACGMFEAVTPEGSLITAETVDPKVDTGLRFFKVDEEQWECPDCGHLTRESLRK